jgi:hypothetical protein
VHVVRPQAARIRVPVQYPHGAGDELVVPVLPTYRRNPDMTIIANHGTSRSETRQARVVHSDRDGITLAHLRALVAAADVEKIPDTTRVRIEDKLGEGANRSGYIQVTTTLDVSDQPTPDGDPA